MGKQTWVLVVTVGLLVLAGCNKGPNYIGEDSSDYLGSRTNSESLPTTGYIVNGTKNALSADFAYGADLSSVAEVEENGGVFYNESGVEQDVFKILANDGVNYARFRLWEDPKSADGVSYGGGHNDLKTDLALAKRAKLAGMKVCLDFHLSDFWTDPDKACQRQPPGVQRRFDPRGLCANRERNQPSLRRNRGQLHRRKHDAAHLLLPSGRHQCRQERL